MQRWWGQALGAIRTRYSDTLARFKKWQQVAIDDPVVGEIRRVFAICLVLIGVTFVGFPGFLGRAVHRIVGP